MKSIRVLCLVLVFIVLIVEYNEKSAEEIMPLHRAAAKGDIGQIKSLIASGIYINARNMVDNTPLHLAAQNGRRDIVELLLAEGAMLTRRT